MRYVCKALLKTCIPLDDAGARPPQAQARIEFGCDYCEAWKIPGPNSLFSCAHMTKDYSLPPSDTPP